MSSSVIPNLAEQVQRVRDQGKKVIGYFGSHIPVELITAANLIPYRLIGNTLKPITKADAFLESVMCPFVRNVFEMGINGEYDFIGGLVMANTCDTLTFSYSVFDYYWKPKFSHFVDIPHKATESAQLYYRSEFDRLRRELCSYSGASVSDEALAQAIVWHNKNRSLQRELYELRKKEPPLISARELLDVIACNLGLPVNQGSQLLEEVITRLKDGEARQPKHGLRLLFWGDQIGNTRMLDVFEEVGANVVVDDLSISYRNFQTDVEVTSDPMTGLTRFYASSLACANTFREAVDERFSRIKRLVIDFKIDGVILYILRYCDVNGFDVPALRDYLRNMGVGVLVIEDDYMVKTLAQIRTRVQAFVEMLEQKQEL